MSDQGGRLKCVGSLDTSGPCRTGGKEERSLVVSAGPQAGRAAGREPVPSAARARAPGSARGSGRSLTQAGRRGPADTLRLVIWLFFLSDKIPRCAGSPRARVGKESARGKVGEQRVSAGAERRAGGAGLPAPGRRQRERRVSPGQRTASRPASPKHRRSRPPHSLGKSRAGRPASRAPSSEPAPPRGDFSQP